MRPNEYPRPDARARADCLPAAPVGYCGVPQAIRVFVNERPVSVPPGTAVQDAVRALDAGLADRLAAGRAYVTDARGIPVEPAAPLGAGDILRVIVSARRGAEDDASA
jgi:hypothetical protein